jgi:hypothetical protein
MSLTLTASPIKIAEGGRVTLTAEPSDLPSYNFSVHAGRIEESIGTPEKNVAFWDVTGVVHGSHQATVTAEIEGEENTATLDVEVTPRTFQVIDRTRIPLQTGSQALWVAIRNSTGALEFNEYNDFIDLVLCAPEDDVMAGGSDELTDARRRVRKLARRRALPFADVDAYRVLKVATEVFMQMRCGVTIDEDDLVAPFNEVDILEERPRFGDPGVTLDAIKELWRTFMSPAVNDGFNTLPYFTAILAKLRDVRVTDGGFLDFPCDAILREKLNHPCLLELLWSYWHEEGMLVQTLNAISMRFQNKHGPSERDPLAHLEIDPLRPLSNLLWGYLQDEQHRITILRRAYEYDHSYGITLLGRAVPALRPADSRSKFLEAFHTLLHLAAVFFKEDDDTTVIADGFPILNALKQVHLLLTEGLHNQYGDMTWTARQEMLIQQWLLSRPEMREFLPSRLMVAYPEPWMGPVDAMKRMQGWTDTSVMHFRDLGVFGERILLGIRFGNWNSVIDRNEAANWARYWRPEIQGYIHAYRAVTGVDVTVELADLAQQEASLMPAVHLQRRLAEQLRGRQQPMPIAAASAPPSWNGQANPQAAVPRRPAPPQLPGRETYR